jgi:transketolase
LQVDATFQANSGHPGAPMGMAPVAHVVFNKFMTFNPKNPKWVNRDRFVLSYVHFCTFYTYNGSHGRQIENCATVLERLR